MLPNDIVVSIALSCSNKRLAVSLLSTNKTWYKLIKVINNAYKPCLLSDITPYSKKVVGNDLSLLTSNVTSLTLTYDVSFNFSSIPSHVRTLIISIPKDFKYSNNHHVLPRTIKSLIVNSLCYGVYIKVTGYHQIRKGIVFIISKLSMLSTCDNVILGVNANVKRILTSNLTRNTLINSRYMVWNRCNNLSESFTMIGVKTLKQKYWNYLEVLVIDDFYGLENSSMKQLKVLAVKEPIYEPQFLVANCPLLERLYTPSKVEGSYSFKVIDYNSEVIIPRSIDKKGKVIFWQYKSDQECYDIVDQVSVSKSYNF